MTIEELNLAIKFPTFQSSVDQLRLEQYFDSVTAKEVADEHYQFYKKMGKMFD